MLATHNVLWVWVIFIFLHFGFFFQCILQGRVALVFENLASKKMNMGLEYGVVTITKSSLE